MIEGKPPVYAEDTYERFDRVLMLLRDVGRRQLAFLERQRDQAVHASAAAIGSIEAANAIWQRNAVHNHVAMLCSSAAAVPSANDPHVAHSFLVSALVAGIIAFSYAAPVDVLERRMKRTAEELDNNLPAPPERIGKIT